MSVFKRKELEAKLGKELTEKVYVASKPLSDKLVELSREKFEAIVGKEKAESIVPQPLIVNYDVKLAAAYIEAHQEHIEAKKILEKPKSENPLSRARRRMK